MLHEIKNSYDIAQYKVDPQSVFYNASVFLVRIWSEIAWENKTCQMQIYPF